MSHYERMSILFHVPILVVFICIFLLGFYQTRAYDKSMYHFALYFRRQRDYHTSLFTRLSMVTEGNLHDGRSSYLPVIFVQVCLDDTVCCPGGVSPDSSFCGGALSDFVVNVVIPC